MLITGELSDIIFKVGKDKHLIRAHKAYLVPVSVLFKTMFCGGDGDSRETKYVTVDDIEKNVFLEMLTYIYTKVCYINDANVMELLYSANKYMICSLKSLCENYIKTRTTGNNALEFFGAAHVSIEVENACLNFILKNPHKYFEDAKFLELSLPALKKIIQQPTINCTSTDLEVITFKWLKHQDASKPVDDERLLEIGLKRTDFENKKYFDAVRNHLYFDYNFKSFLISTTVYRHVNANICGLGIYTGVRIKRRVEIIKVSIYQGNHTNSDSGLPLLRRIKKKLTQTSEVVIKDIMFPITVCSGPILIEIIFKKLMQRVAFRTKFKVREDYFLFSVNSCL
jgi:hypothetical protein